ncbi:iron transporter [Methylobacterium sp. NEAU 140]|uniref:iron transporter n=1 Tax=Methylobacterium sp. NEAU 140 TaxID=3064945 RepID=UPI002733D1CB|nr:iron transporter [Methylobacterium sp. NEAU 140]MDP4023804.1 iron transporter [Methylobacterium sp. NEAU 140]
MSGRPAIGLVDRLGVAGRVALAAFGGYAVAALAAALLALSLPLPRSEAVSAGTLGSFALMAAAVVWVFAARTLARAALGLGVVAAGLGGGVWLAGGFA